MKKLVNKKFKLAFVFLVSIMFTKAQLTTYTFAGNGTSGYSGDGGNPNFAQLSFPYGLAMDASGNFYIGEAWNYRVRKVSTSFVIQTVAGTGTSGFSGNGVAATSANLNFAAGIAFDGGGNYYIADWYNNRIRKVSTSGTITTIAGTGGCGYSGDGGPAILATICDPSGIAVDATGNIYVTDRLNHALRKIAPSGTITTVAGTGISGFSGDGGSATSAQLSFPHGVAIDAAGNIYIADDGNACVRKINTSGIITTFAGTGGLAGYSGDGGLATLAQLTSPEGIAISNSGNIYISDQASGCIREINSVGIINTVIFGAGIPIGIVVDASNTIYFCNALNHIVQYAPCSSPTISASSSSSIICGSQSATLTINGATNYNWSTGATTNTIVVSPSVTTTYTVAGKNISSCSATQTISIIAGNSPTISAISNSSVLCTGQTASLTASGANSYTWNTSATTSVIAVSPTVTTTYSVSGANSSGCTNITTITQSVSLCTGIDEKNINNNFSVFPNPTSNLINLYFNKQNDKSEVRLINSLGQTIIEKNPINSQKATIDISNQPTGIYFLEIIIEGKTERVKVIKE